MLHRHLQPEWLDSLPAVHPDAIHSRRDLRLINFFMGNERWVVTQVERFLQQNAASPLPRLLELGAGGGHLSKSILKRSLLPPSHVHALDLVAPPTDWPPGALWHQLDLLTEPIPPTEIIAANLILHHFDTATLQRLGQRLPNSVKLFVISEPERRSLHLWQGRLLHLFFRLNRVTRHDLSVSIAAGFRGRELIQTLGIADGPDWRITQFTTFLGAHRVVATRH